MTDLARLLWARVMAAHKVIGAPVEEFDEFATGEWDFYPIGKDGVAGVKRCPELDGDAFVIALPTDHSKEGTRRAIEIMRERTASGRCLYTLAWKEHWAAININQRVGGELLGLDGDGFYHFKHTSEGLPHGKEKHAEGP